MGLFGLYGGAKCKSTEAHNSDRTQTCACLISFRTLMQIAKHRGTRAKSKGWEAQICWNGEKRGEDRNTEAETRGKQWQRTETETTA